MRTIKIILSLIIVLLLSASSKANGIIYDTIYADYNMSISTICLQNQLNSNTVLEKCNLGDTWINQYNIDTNGCILVTSQGTVGYNLDTICILVGDTLTQTIDTTQLIISVLPKAFILRDTNLINSTTVICLAVHQGMQPSILTIVNCGHANTSGNIYTQFNTGCVMVTRSNVVGYNLDTICFVYTDTLTGISDTTIFIFSNSFPIQDTINGDTIFKQINCIGCTDTICLVNPFPNAMSQKTCDGRNIITTVNSNCRIEITNECIYFTSSNIGRDTICIIQCDTIIGSCLYNILFLNVDSSTLCDTTTCLLPGDADHDFTVNNYDALAIGLSYNRNGIVRPNATSQYTLQACDDWNTTHYYGYNDKFADCNGDGIINSSDALVINQNYIVQAQNHFNHRQSNLDSLPSVTLTFDTLPTMVVNGNCDGAELVADINVGSADQPLINGYGIAFSVNYPFDNDSCFSVTVDLDPNSWFQTNNPVLLFYKNIPQYNRVDVSVVRTDGLPRTGNGRIGRIKMITEGGIFRGGRLSSNKIFDFSVSDVVAINQIGQRIDINGSSTSVNFVVAGVKQNKVDGLKMYPNPTNSKLFIHAKENIASIKIIDLSGRVINEFLPDKNDMELDFSTTENGMYIIEIKGKNSVSYEKIFKQ